MLFKTLIVLMGLLSLWSSVQAQDSYEVRVAWIKSMKEVLLDLEKNHANELLTVEEKSFLKKFRLIEDAWAGNPYDCFFAGWPSQLKVVDGKKYCSSPKTSNAEYKSGECKKDELQCQPSLFGNSLCVSFKSKEDMQSALARCENKFQKERKGSYEFLKHPTQDQITDLMELSYLATDVCEKGVQKNTGMCKNLLKKVPMALKSLQDAWPEAFVSKTAEASSSFEAPVALVSDAVCVAPTAPEIVQEALDLNQVKEKQLEQMYFEFKDKFEKSALCKPENIVNDPAQKPNGLLIQKLIVASEDIFKEKDQLIALQKIGQDFHLDILHEQAILERKSRNKQKDKLIIQSLLLKKFENASKSQTDFMQKEIEEELVQNHIFRRNKDGKAECPFISLDAFKKAVEGKANIGHIKGLNNPSVLTVVDYTQPSNQRRLFVLDMDRLEVMHNTWVGQGFGGKTAGIDGLGSSPTFSNRSESKKSSDGFILATKPDEGKKWGPNILLQGIDKNNTNMEKREMVLHGWYTPFENYNLNKDSHNYKESRTPASIMGIGLDRLDPEKASVDQMRRAINHLKSSTYTAPFLMPTAGCLGVSVAPAQHLDRQKRPMTQLEMLRLDLPGSLIFSYSGEKMESKYFE